MKAFLLISFLVLWAALSAFAQEANPEPKAQTTLVKYMVPKSSIHFCNDQDEGERRFLRSNVMTTADVYALKGGPGIKVLNLIRREAPIREM